MKRPPNVVLILADDLGWGDLACQNPHSKIPTPHLDRLARHGMRFTDAHSPSSVCSPTRYAILTGRYAWRGRLRRSVLWAWDPPLIERDRLTLSKMLRRQGYATAAVGKWHLGWTWPTRSADPPKQNAAEVDVDFAKPIAGGPLAFGFDHYFGDDVPNFPPYCFIEDDRTVGIPSEQKPEAMYGRPGPMLPGWELGAVMPEITRRAVAWIDARAESPDEPFFLYFPLTAPHTPIVPAEPHRGKSGAGAYGDFVHQVDASVGAVLDALARHDLADDTLVIFTSDNGSPARVTSRAPTGSVPKQFGHDPSGGWRGMKSDAWEGGHRVPFLVRWPGRIEAGRVCDETICHVDLMATCAALVGIALPDDAAEDSHDLTPLWFGAKPGDEPKGERDGALREATVHHSGNGMFAIRQGPWKLILGLGSGGFSRPRRIEPQDGGPTGQLYHLVDDPREQVNRSSERPDIVARLSGLLERYKSSGRSR